MDPHPEIANLRQEVAKLRQQMDALLHFITIEMEGKTRQPRSMLLRCSVITMEKAEAPHDAQMHISASENGPAIGLWDSRQKGRLILSVEKDEPRLTLHTAELKDAVLLHADQAEGRGLVAVLDNGNPRALMKAGPDNSGAISVVHDDGQSRVTLYGTEDSGTVLLANPDMKATVKISAETELGGGQIVVNGPNGKPAVIVCHHHGIGGVVLTNGTDGQPAASLPDAGYGNQDDEKS